MKLQSASESVNSDRPYNYITHCSYDHLFTV